MCRIVKEVFLGSNRESVDDCLDAGDTARDDDGLVRLLVGIHPASKLDDAVLNGADVDGALTKRRIVAERLEHSFLELLRTVQRSFWRLDLLVEIRIELVFIESLVVEIFFSLGAASECVLDS